MLAHALLLLSVLLLLLLRMLVVVKLLVDGELTWLGHVLGQGRWIRG